MGKVAKSGGTWLKVEKKWGKVGRVAKSGEKLLHVSGKKWRKVEKSVAKGG